LRPDRDELIARNIIRVVSEQEIQETKEAIGAKLIRYAEQNYNLIYSNSFKKNKKSVGFV
jgi:hypothetical protein